MFALASIVLAVYLLAPKPGLEFSLDSAAVYEYFVRADADLAEAHRTLAYWLRLPGRATKTWSIDWSSCSRSRAHVSSQRSCSGQQAWG
jgi:hypothetical protein